MVRLASPQPWCSLLPGVYQSFGPGRTRDIDRRVRWEQSRPTKSISTSEAALAAAGKDAHVERPGVYRGQCAEYCGAQHALMAFYVVAMERDEFYAWYARQSKPAPDPTTAFPARGKTLFLENGCGACHTIRGTPAEGKIRPDLSHVGGRVSLAAGTLPQQSGNTCRLDFLSPAPQAR